MPLFSVVMPVYNREDLLPRTLASLKNQTFRDFEVVIVDDGSTDGTPAILDEASDWIRVIHQSNRGEPAARGRAIDEAAGTYLAFLDSDDLWFPWTLQRYAEAIVQYSQPALVMGRLVRFFEDEAELSKVTDKSLQCRFWNDFYEGQRDGGVMFMGTPNTVVRSDVFHDVGGLEHVRLNGADLDLLFRLGTAHGFVRINEPAACGYRTHAGAMTANPAPTVQGFRWWMRRELDGAYPGGVARQEDRRWLIAFLGRAITCGLLADGHHREAWQVYRSVFGWNLRQRRVKFLAGFPVLAARERLQRLVRR